MLVFIMWLFPGPVNLLRTNLPGELRLAPQALSPVWHALSLFLLFINVVLHAVHMLQGRRMPSGAQLCCVVELDVEASVQG